MRHGENEVRLQALHMAPPQQPAASVVKLEGGKRETRKKSCVRSSGIITVLDFGRPSISGSIRSIKMYNWA